MYVCSKVIILHAICSHCDCGVQQLPILRVNFTDFRLVKFDSVNEYIEQSFDNEWESPISLVLDGVKSIYPFDLLAETKQPYMQFEPYSVGG